MAAYETAVRSSSSSPQQDDLVGRAGIEPATFRVSDGCTPLPCSRPMEPRAGIEPASPLYRSGASPAMLAELKKVGAGGANRTLFGRRAVGAPYRTSALSLSYAGGAEGRIRTAVWELQRLGFSH